MLLVSSTGKCFRQHVYLSSQTPWHLCDATSAWCERWTLRGGHRSFARKSAVSTSTCEEFDGISEEPSAEPAVEIGGGRRSRTAASRDSEQEISATRGYLKTGFGQIGRLGLRKEYLELDTELARMGRGGLQIGFADSEDSYLKGGKGKGRGKGLKSGPPFDDENWMAFKGGKGVGKGKGLKGGYIDDEYMSEFNGGKRKGEGKRFKGGADFGGDYGVASKGRGKGFKGSDSLEYDSDDEFSVWGKGRKGDHGHKGQGKGRRW
eukprot:gnl/TRDRNA2_/TRDRNA2_162708_c0_seq1.p1 gnl/TRDRNA2_/TRDRNA2_162708_c0~~gnl/TRDRNA2_/TRDRNA2_162708_c0_seq1.p1  ORF type:complete len:263 (+),score=44.18 gnl/TRDRNA2_/TRDRNA2_162708_c0_seq1:66-854(+)